MNWITLAVASVALWQLARIRYFRAFPWFYAKLALATLVYATQQPYSPSWWLRWWEPGAVSISILMLLSVDEALRRFCEKVPLERKTLWAMQIFSLATIALPLAWIWHWGIAIFTAIEAGIAVPMIAIVAYDLLSPIPAHQTARIHFYLLTTLNTTMAAVDLAYRFAVPDRPEQWEVLHALFTCAYCILLILWAFGMPLAIKSEADAAAARPAG